MSVTDLLRIARRGKWVVAVSIAVCGTLAAVVADRLPDYYESSTLIRVLPQQVLPEYAQGASGGRAEAQQRLQTVREQILARPVLEEVIRTHNLYGAGANPGAAIGRLRQDVIIDVTPRSESFQVSFQAPGPELARAVTAQLADLLISGASKDREALAQATGAFLDSELEDARRRLAEHEKRIEAYRLRHAGELPSQLQSNLQTLSSLQMQAQTLLESLNLDRLRRLTLERTLADFSIDTTPVLPEPSGTTGTNLETLPPGATPDMRLAAARDALQNAELRLTEGHPDVVRLRRLVANLEAEAKRVATAPTLEPVPSLSLSLSVADMQRRNRMRELRAEIDTIDRQIAFKQGEELRLRGAIAQHQGRVEAAPRRESELTTLTRDYDTLQTTYRTLLEKRESSKIGENLERRQVGEQYRIVEAAYLAVTPSGPNRPLINLAGAFAGLLLGAGVVLGTALVDRSLHTEKDVHAAVSLRVLAAVPDLVAPAERRRRRVVRLGRSAAALATVAGWLAVVVVTWR